MAENGETKASVGFKIASKARPKVAVNVEEKQEHRQLITGVAGSVIQAAEPSAEEKQQYVIPKLENTYKTGVGKFVPSFVPESSTAAITGKADDRYERAAAPDQPAITSYGLEIRQRRDKDSNAEQGAGASGPMVPGKNRVDEVAQLKADLEALPEEADLEDYEALPVEEFGKALLRGLGWSDGQGVGRKRQVVEPKQVIRRPDRLGLGANPAAPPPDKRPRKMGDKPKQDLVAAPAADGSMRHRIGLDEQLVPRLAVVAGPAAGKAMLVVGGRHAGLSCVVREILPREEGSTGPARVRVELHPSCEVVMVSADDLADKGARGAAAAAAAASQPAAAAAASDDRQQRQQGLREDARDRRRERSSRDRDNRDTGEREADRDRERERHRGREGSGRDDHGSRQQDRGSDRGRQQQQQQQQHRSSSGSYDRERESSSRQQQRQQQQVLPPSKLWVAPLIRVRVIDKRIQGGRLYLKKGTVLDVALDGSCDVRMEEGRQVVRVHQDQLETVVPKEAGAAAMVVQGKHKGRKGRLLQVSLSGGAAALQLVGDMEVVRLLLDDVAQFMGHLEEEED